MELINSDNKDRPPEVNSKLLNLATINTTPQITDLRYITYTSNRELFRRV
jgi:hypothetical protein